MRPYNQLPQLKFVAHVIDDDDDVIIASQSMATGSPMSLETLVAAIKPNQTRLNATSETKASSGGGRQMNNLQVSYTWPTIVAVAIVVFQWLLFCSDLCFSPA